MLDPTVAHLYELTTEGTLQVIDKAELAAVVRADRAKRDAERKALDAAQEAELQVEWEKRGKSGRVPRVGSERTSPIAPEWWDMPWFDAWVAGGCDHQLLGISVEGMERLLEDALESKWEASRTNKSLQARPTPNPPQPPPPPASASACLLSAARPLRLPRRRAPTTIAHAQMTNAATPRTIPVTSALMLGSERNQASVGF